MYLTIEMILMFWYQSNISLIVLNGEKLHVDFLFISKGVRQGGILSPQLFVPYLNDLSRLGLLVMSNTGCYIDDQCMNHLMYADGICLQL